MMEEAQSYRLMREKWERDAMRLLCSERIGAEVRVRLAGLLKEYVFVDAVSGAVFEAIVGIGAVAARRLRELLPGRVTNLGFPDFELSEYLGKGGGAEEDIDKLFESLLELTEVRPVAQPEAGKKALGQSA